MVNVWPVVRSVFLPSAICTIAAAGWTLATMGGSDEFKAVPPTTEATPRGSLLVATMGLGGLMLVPVFKAVTGLPPFAGLALPQPLHRATPPLLARGLKAKHVKVEGYRG